MPIVKEKVIQVVESLPDDATLEDVMAELYFQLQVERGLQQLDQGKGLNHEHAKQQIGEWLRK